MDDYTYFLNGFNPETDNLVKQALQNVKDSGLLIKTLEKAQVRLFNGNSDTLKKRLGFAKLDGQSILQVYRLIEFPYFDEKNGITRYEYKPFPEMYFKGDEKPRKYLQAKGQPATPYVLSGVWIMREKPNKPVWITEGVKKCLALLQQGRYPIGLSGVWNFKPGKAAKKGNSEDKGDPLWQHLEAFQWKGRTVYIGFDNDLWTNPGVRYALYELAFKLYGRGAVVKFPLWTAGKGIDDYLTGQNDPGEALRGIENNAKSLDAFLTYEHQEEILRAISETTKAMDSVLRDNLIALIAKAFNRKPKEIQGIVNSRVQKDYRETIENLVESYFVDGEGCLCRWQQKRDGMSSSIRIANFTARISEEITEDNGQEIAKKFSIEGKTKGAALPKVFIPSKHLQGMNWVIEQYGNKAIIEPGQNTKDYLRHFVQAYSEKEGVLQRTVYTHTGWRKVDGKWVYLMANGAIGGGNDVSVSLPGGFLEQGRYCLPLTPENETEAIKTSLSFLNIGKPEITFPAYAFLFLSPLTTVLDTAPNFSGYFVGETGSLKTTVGTLLLGHFGRFSMNGLSNFESTANLIEKRAFVLKDTLFVLDDYHPSPRQKEAQQKESIAERVIRSTADRTGRERMNPDATEKGKYVPRGMILITGEEIVRVQSTLARLMVVEFKQGDIFLKELSELQGKTEILPCAMTSFILWVQERIESIQESFKTEFPTLRQKAFDETFHRKLPEQIAFLQFSLNTILAWAREKGAIDESDRNIIGKMGWHIFCDAAMKHSERIKLDDPVKLFFDIFDALLAQGTIRLDHKFLGYDECLGNKSGKIIGFYDDDHYHLYPTATWHEIQSYLRFEGGYFPFTQNTFYRMLENRGLVNCNGNGNHRTHIARILGKPQRVLTIKREKSNPEDDRDEV